MLEIILIITLICVAVHSITREDCLFSFWQKVIRDPDTLNYRTEMFNPITECLPCMASFWTCVYLGYISDMQLIDAMSYLCVLLVLLVSFVAESKTVDRAALFFYLIGVCVFVVDAGFGTEGFLVMFGVMGGNVIASKVIK